MKKDTIAAIATALSDSGIGIVRVSGPEAVNVCNKIFVNASGRPILKDAASHTLHYGFIIQDSDINECLDFSNGKRDDSWKELIIDEVMVAVMLAPRSYTT